MLVLFCLGFSLIVRPEKVVNPYGSTAGANSGDFHLYRQTRAREMERMKDLTTAEMERIKDAEFQDEIKRNREDEEKKTEKKRKKRQRHKEAKLRRKMLKKAGVTLDDGPDDDEGDDDFEVPFPDNDGPNKPQIETNKDDGATTKDKEEVGSPQNGGNPVPFPNDGSFLEMMRKQLEGKQTENGSKSS